MEHRHAFSHGGGSIAAQYSGVKQVDADREKTVILVMTVPSCEVLLSFTRTSGTTGHLRPMWSWNDAILASSSRLMHIQTSRIVTMGGILNLEMYGTSRSFTRSCSLYGQTCMTPLSSMVAMVFHTATGQELSGQNIAFLKPSLFQGSGCS